MAVRGAIAGCLATIPMTLVMGLLQRQSRHLRAAPMPPRLVTRRSAQKVGVPLKRNGAAETTMTALAHFSFGSAAGSVYEQLLRYAGRPGVFSGTAFGLGVWGVSYLGVLPALQLQLPANKELPQRTATLIAAHVIWGGTLGLLVRYLTRRRGAFGRVHPIDQKHG